ncbi:MAG: hypothetical protein HQL40_10355 [Alphaproteobacteria bacterium]|nr:hypothetical protein [Alphaproteobacteria bacterium]
MGHFNEVLEAYGLSDAARDYAAKAGRDVPQDEYFAEIFAKSPLVDIERTRLEGGSPLAKVFFRNPYGLQWRAEYKDWIPFRHGDVDLNNI